MIKWLQTKKKIFPYSSLTKKKNYIIVLFAHFELELEYQIKQLLRKFSRTTVQPYTSTLFSITLITNSHRNQILVKYFSLFIIFYSQLYNVIEW